MSREDVLSSVWIQDFVRIFASKDLTLDWIAGRDCLDAGGGSGILSASLAYWGAHRVVYLDIDPIQLAKARRMLTSNQGRLVHIEWVLGDVTMLPFADESFDCVVSTRVLHHLKEPQAAIRELERVCRPTGFLYHGSS